MEHNLDVAKELATNLSKENYKLESKIEAWKEDNQSNPPNSQTIDKNQAEAFLKAQIARINQDVSVLQSKMKEVNDTEIQNEDDLVELERVIESASTQLNSVSPSNNLESALNSADPQSLMQLITVLSDKISDE